MRVLKPGQRKMLNTIEPRQFQHDRPVSEVGLRGQVHMAGSASAQLL